jgi:hypothetical protein
MRGCYGQTDRACGSQIGFRKATGRSSFKQFHLLSCFQINPASYGGGEMVLDRALFIWCPINL